MDRRHGELMDLPPPTQAVALEEIRAVAAVRRGTAPVLNRIRRKLAEIADQLELRCGPWLHL